MHITYATNETCDAATGVVVVIDVIRAFTTAAYAFAAGARVIMPVRTVEEAVVLRANDPDLLLMGEVDGYRPDGFDLSNSPSALLGQNLTGRRIIQRTSAGTQGLVRSRRASHLIACSFVCAQATARLIQRLQPSDVTFVITGRSAAWAGDDDLACAEYLTALLHAPSVDPAPFLRRVRDSSAGQIFADPQHPDFPAADIECCTATNCFDFALVVADEADRMVMRSERVSG